MHLLKRRTGISFGVFIGFCQLGNKVSASFFQKKKRLQSKEGANPWWLPPPHAHARTHSLLFSTEAVHPGRAALKHTDTLSTKRLIAALQTAATDPSTSSTIDASDKELSQKINCTRYQEVCTWPNYDAVCV